MSVRKLRNTWWVDFRVDFIRYRKKSPENTRAGAAAYEALLKSKFARGDSLEKRPDAPMFSEFVPVWMESYVAANNKLSEQRMKASILRHHLVPFFGKMRLDHIVAEDIERYKARKREEGLSPKSINNQLTVLGRCLRSAVEWGRILLMPRIALMKSHSRRVDFLTEDEARRLLIAPAPELLHRMIFVALRTGLRLGELLGLSWSDIDFEGNTITVQQSWVRREMTTTKSHRIRHVPLAGDLRHLLYTERRSKGLVFPFPGLGEKPWSTDGATRELKRLCRNAGIERKVGWHLLRHTFASHLAMKGVPLRVIQELLGHSTIAMTERYAHLTSASLHDAVRVLEPIIELRGQPAGNTVISWKENRSVNLPVTA